MVFVIADNAKAIGGGPFADKYPDRVFDVGIAEQNMVMTSAGFALAGKLPFCNAFSNFLALRAIEQIRTFVAHTEAEREDDRRPDGRERRQGRPHPRGPGGHGPHPRRARPGRAARRPTWSRWRRRLSPRRSGEDPVYIRIGRMATAVFYDQNYVFRIGKAERLREGWDATIISTGVMLAPALEAAATLAQAGRDRARARHADRSSLSTKRR